MHYEKIVHCKYCKKEFLRKNIGKRYCSDKCKLLGNIKKDDNGCWNWQLFKSAGYGRVRIKEKSCSAHRASYLLFKGEITNGKLICHTCDNRGCINPDHLYAGSQKDNIKDMDERGRRGNINGEKHPNSKFIDEDIIKIRKMLENGIKQTKIAKSFNCDPSTISDIKNHKLWRHI